MKVASFFGGVSGTRAFNTNGLVTMPGIVSNIGQYFIDFSADLFE
ncbi:hypothetical protein BTN50_0325 [Candidatus Enterovibrio altilux]|uniref:Uncharacterized protein n=1 Tax=Candidatus Enterovibrio altilux TaxID=1927128 RepID=A0A291B788_9GAMM|nr:hypothetical protein BTN50_0325 [Candidatus Enterovibrio luxaltus]